MDLQPPASQPQLGLSNVESQQNSALEAYRLQASSTIYQTFHQTQAQAGRATDVQCNAQSTLVSGQMQHEASPDDRNMTSPFSTGSVPPAVASKDPRSPMGPPIQSRKRKAPTLYKADWEPYKPRIIDIHIIQGLPLTQVMHTIDNEYGFKAEYVDHSYAREHDLLTNH